MIKWNFLILLFSLILSASCTRERKVAKIIPGHTTISEVLDWLDEPVNVRTSGFDSHEEVFVWDDLTVQVDRKIVKAIHRIQAGEEKSLQYWRHEFKQEQTNLQKIAFNKDEDIYQLNIPGRGINVVYNAKADQVIKVVY